MKIGLAGVMGSFSEEAALLYVKNDHIQSPELVYLSTTENVLSALEKGEIETGIFAIENSNGGVVTEYLSAIAAHRFLFEKLFEIQVSHMLITLPGKNREDIKKIVSQRQALRQCRIYTARVWPDAEILEYIDTATAVKDLKEGKISPDTGIIASRRAAEIYELAILDEGVQDLKFNFTNFIIAKPFPSA